MAKISVFVITACVTSNGDFLEQNKKAEIDLKDEKKLFDLGLVEKFDAEKHDIKKDELSSANADIVKLKDSVNTLKQERNEAGQKLKDSESKNELLKKQLEEANAKIAELEKKVKQ